MKKKKITSLDELDEFLNELREENVQRRGEIEINLQLDNENLEKIAKRVGAFNEKLETTGTCKVKGEITYEDIESQGLEKRVKKIKNQLEKIQENIDK